MRIRGFRLSNLGNLLLGVGLFLVPARTFPESADVEVTGDIVEMYADDFVNHRAERFFALHSHSDGAVYRLRLPDTDRRDLHTGMRVRVRGKQAGSEITLPANGTSVQTVEAVTTTTMGEQKTIVIGINFQNASLECSQGQIQGMMFTNASSVSGLYLETSHGYLWFTGDVVGPFKINYNGNSSCDYNSWASAADAAAQAAGVDLSQYAHKVYVFPKVNNCSWAGLGTIGGNPSRAWIAACDLADVYAHELGHNLGMHHASTDSNNDGVNDCEYCDNSDFMGYGGVGLRALNGPHKEEMGWQPAGKVQTVSDNGVFMVAPLEQLPSNTPYPQTLKIAKPGTSEFYYFSYRRPLGYDVNMPSSYADRTSVHYYDGTGTEQTFLIKTLSDSGSFTDPTTGLTIAQLSHNNDFVMLNVSFGCTPKTPGLNASPAAQSAAPGATTAYVVTITNADSIACGNTTFLLTSSGPIGWTAAVVPNSLTLAPGQAGTARISAASGGATPSGDYTTTVRVTDNFNLIHNASVSLTCTVLSSAANDMTPPTAPTNLIGTPRKRRVALTWTGSTDNVRVVAYRVYRDGLLVKQTKSLKFTDHGLTAGASYSYTVTARDAAGNESAPSSAISAIPAGIPPAR
jgi:hypothetical protein